MNHIHHKPITVIVLTAVAYDYGQPQILFRCDALTSTFHSPYIYERGTVQHAFQRSAQDFMSLIIHVDRIHLGQQTTTTCQVCGMMLIRSQRKPWTWVSTLFIFVCIKPPVALFLPVLTNYHCRFVILAFSLSCTSLVADVEC